MISQKNMKGCKRTFLSSYFKARPSLGGARNPDFKAARQSEKFCLEEALGSFPQGGEELNGIPEIFGEGTGGDEKKA